MRKPKIIYLKGGLLGITSSKSSELVESIKLLIRRTAWPVNKERLTRAQTTSGGGTNIHLAANHEQTAYREQSGNKASISA